MESDSGCKFQDSNLKSKREKFTDSIRKGEWASILQKKRGIFTRDQESNANVIIALTIRT